jgi:RNA polymerase sigma-70 factor (ECF subfamily)
MSGPTSAARPDDAAGADDQSALAERVRRGDAQAFEMLFRAHAANLAAYAYRIVGSRAVAEEIVDDVFLNIWARRQTWHVRGAPEAYLFAAVQNKALSARRRERVARAFVDRSCRAGGERMARPADAALIEGETRAAITDAMATLTPRMRTVFALRYNERLTFAEIGARLGIVAKTAENLAGRAVKRVRAFLTSLGVSPEA